MRIREVEFGDVDVKTLTPELVQQYIAEHVKQLMALPGNQAQYEPAAQPADPQSPLRGKKVAFLGSSVVLGQAALNTSFVETLVQTDGIEALKEAVNGTSMVNRDGMGPSYIKRVMNMDKDFKADAFVMQVSTNDATQGFPLGEISESTNRDDFDTLTVTGAMEYLISYIKENWDCPLIIFTGTKFLHSEYEAIVNRAKELQNKYDFVLLDMWNDEEMNATSDEDYDLYMNDPIHPTKAGYVKWWTPKFRECLINTICE